MLRLQLKYGLSRLIRLPLKLIPNGTTMPVLSGPNRGFRWITGSMTHGCWIGTYEKGIASIVRALAQPGMLAFDVGANVGYYSLLLSKAVGATGNVIAFEPEPRNLELLRNHLKINGIMNVQIVDAAVAEAPGQLFFSGTRATGHIAASGISIRAVQLDNFATPDLIKMDIEGGEVAALHGAKRILKEHKTTWIVALHGDNLLDQTRTIFSSGDYRTRLLAPDVICAEP